MRVNPVLTFAGSFVLAAVVAAQEPGQAKLKSDSAKGDTPIFIPAGELKWADLDPKAAPGIKIADVWGDHTTGAYGAFLKFPAGFLAPLHTHTDAIKIVVLSGTYTQMPDGKPEQRMGPGSYVFQPGGSYKHTTGCDKASECLVFIQSSAKFDLRMVPATAP